MYNLFTSGLGASAFISINVCGPCHHGGSRGGAVEPSGSVSWWTSCDAVRSCLNL
ncbi:hypothetical protein BFJ70_g12971 [Fusarium oxysporum]|nr:hypothetical protein BFJ70_g12971 [Fusarium oxysporum]